VDAIVNAANERMSHGAGVAKAISRGSGQFDSDDDSIVDRESADWIHDHKRLETGRMAAITSAGNLPCKWVVHVAGPIFPVGTEDRDRKREARDLLRGAVMAALHKADEHECSSVALPAISSGIFGFPLKLCARILVESSVEFASQARFLKRISFTNIDEKTTNAMAEAFEKFGPPSMQADASGHPPSVPPTRRLDPLGGSEGSPSKRRRPDGLREEAGAVGLAKGVAEGDGGETSKCSSPSAPPAVSARVSTESHTKKAK
jgi:O-acetyl-ADP-ribose deacetylase (regulator of RNase III)